MIKWTSAERRRSVADLESPVLLQDERLAKFLSQVFESWAIDYPPLGEAYNYKSKLYYSESTNLRDHEPLYLQNGVKYQPHIQQFDIADLKFDDPSKQGWKVHSKSRKPEGNSLCSLLQHVAGV